MDAHTCHGHQGPYDDDNVRYEKEDNVVVRLPFVLLRVVAYRVYAHLVIVGARERSLRGKNDDIESHQVDSVILQKRTCRSVCGTFYSSNAAK